MHGTSINISFSGILFHILLSWSLEKNHDKLGKSTGGSCKFKLGGDQVSVKVSVSHLHPLQTFYGTEVPTVENSGGEMSAKCF